MGAKLVPVRPLRRFFSGILTAVYFHHSFFPTRRALCALRSVRTERRKTAGFQTFQLAALCAPCVVGARKGAKQQALRGYRYKADARPPGATAFPVRRRGVCRRGVYRAAVGCTVPPWGLPSSRAGVERAPAQAALFPLGGA